MNIRARHLAPFFGWLLAIALSTQGSEAATCESLKGLVEAQLPNAKITAAESITDGFFKLPPFCRVAATLTPEPVSNIKIEVWMPNEGTKPGWNGKYLGTGNGGFGITILYPALVDGLSRGYAVANTDMGTSDPGDSQEAIGSALLHTPRKWLDFSFRATQEMTKAAKVIISTFYGRPPVQSYYAGCSNGGGQALMQAQRFPDDYDGIIAGAPYTTRHAVLGLLWAFQAARLNGKVGLLPPDKLKLLKEKVLASCRGNLSDGGYPSSDDFLNNPQSCRFDPRKLQCKPLGQRAGCLSPEQAEAAFKIYAGPRLKDDPNHRTIYPGWPFGSEGVPTNWLSFEGVLWLGTEYFPAPPAWVFDLNFKPVFGDNWKWDEFEFTSANVETFDTGCVQGHKDLCGLTKMGDATNPNLNEFKASKPSRPYGGKLIMYHGQADGVVPPQNSIDYYNSVIQSQGSETSKFARFFLVPGMAHCGGGPGPHVFNLAGLGPSNDMLSALDKWVTTGDPPKSIIASKFYVDDNFLSGIAMNRPLCPYPQVARYKGGKLDPTADDSFECR